MGTGQTFHRKKLAKTIAVLSITITLSCCLFLFFSVVSFPSTKAIANQYLSAILSEDFDNAIELARSNERCRDLLQESALQDINQFGGVDIRELTIEIRGNSGSDDEMQFAWVEFEFLEPYKSEWQLGLMVLVTDHEVPGFRYLCGNTVHD